MTAVIQSGTPTTTINSTAGTSNTVTVPASMTTSHYLIYTVVVSGNKTASMSSTISGWTTLLAPALNSASTATIAVYGRFWASGMSNPSVSWTTSNKNVGSIVPFLGVDATTQLDVAVSSATGSSTTASSPSVASVTTGACRVHIVGKATIGTAVPEDGMVEAVDITTSTSGQVSMHVTHQSGMYAGATGTRASTITNGSWIAVTVWLRPAVADTIGLIQSKTTKVTAGATTATATFPNALTAGTLITAAAATWNGGTGVSINDVDYGAGSVNLTLLEGSNDPGPNIYDSLWYIENNANTTAATATARRSSGTDDITLWVAEWGGIATSSAADATASTTATGTSTSAAVTTGTLPAGDVLVVGVVTGDQGVTSGDSDYIQRFLFSSTADISMYVQSRVTTGGATDTITTAIPSGTWTALAGVFKAPASGVSGSLTKTLDALTASSTGTVDVAGTLTKTLGALTSSATGTVDVTGTASKTLGSLTSTATGTVAVSGTSAVTLGALTLSADGTVAAPGLNGEATITLGALTASGAGTVGIAGTASPTLGSLTTSAAGTVAVTGTASVTLGAATSSAAGTVGVSGTLTATLGAVASTGAGTVSVSGTSSATLGALTSTATGTVAVTGTASNTLGALTSDAQGSVGSVPIEGTLSATLGTLTGTSAGTVAVAGTASVTLGPLSVVAAGEAAISGEASVTLGALVSSAAGAVAVTGQGAVTLGEVTGTAQGAVEVTGTLAVTLGALTLAAYEASPVEINGRVWQPPAAVRVFTPQEAERTWALPDAVRVYAVQEAERTWQPDAAVREFVLPEDD